MKNTEHIFISYVEYFLAHSYHELGKFFSLVINFFFDLLEDTLLPRASVSTQGIKIFL